MPRAERLLWPSLAVAASSLFWGTMWIPLRRVAASGIPASWSGVLIYALPALVVLPLIILRFRRIRAGGWALLAVGLGIGGCNALFAVALTFGEVGMIVLLFYLNPIWTTIMERLLLGIPIVRYRVIGIALGVIGMVALQGLAGRWPLPANLSEWMGLLAGICWAVGLVGANVARGSTILDKTAVQFVCSATIAVLLVLALDRNAAMPNLDELRTAFPWILATGVFWIVPAMGLSLWGAARMSPARASMLLMFEVLVALASAAWLAGEEIGLNKVIGGALIIAASLVDAWGSAQADRAAAPLRAAEAE